MKLVDRRAGDDAWFYTGGGDNPLTKGKVVLVCSIPGYQYEHYIVEVQTSIEPLLYVRDGFSVSDAEDLPIGMYRRNNADRIAMLRKVIERAQEELDSLDG